MFSLHLDADPITIEITPERPIYLELDSTSSAPDPSPWIKCYIRLPDGYSSVFDALGTTGGATVKFEGTFANYWNITDIDPALEPNQPNRNEVRVEVIGGPVGKSLWMRANTVFGEVPVDDRSTSIKVDGEVKKV